MLQSDSKQVTEQTVKLHLSAKICTITVVSFHSSEAV